MTAETPSMLADVHPHRPKLSVIFTGRNDSYMGNFKYRLSTALNHFARNLARLEKLAHAELVVTDWNSEAPLAQALPLLPEAIQITQFLMVPPSEAQKIQPGVKFSGTLATNAALRRARGEYLMLFDADSLMSQHSLQQLFELLEGKVATLYPVNDVYWIAGRCQIPWEVAERLPSLDDWDRYLFVNTGVLQLESRQSGLGIASVGLTMHRSLWHACRGYAEQYHGWGWVDAELALRLTQKHPMLDLAVVGVWVFHMAHASTYRPVNIGGGHKQNPHIVSAGFTANDENWGLGKYDFNWMQASTASPPTQFTDPLPNQLSRRSRSELVAEMTEPQLSLHLKHKLSTQMVQAHEWGALYALAWYAWNYYPRTYLEFGIRDGYCAAVVAGLCPGLEAYGIDSWQSEDSQSPRPIISPDYAVLMMHRAGFLGNVRLVTGDSATALERLASSNIGPLKLDLVLLRGISSAINPTESALQLRPYLAFGSALVFTEADSEKFALTWRELKASFSDWLSFECPEKLTGILIAVPSHPATIALLPDEAKRFAKAWRPILWGRLDTIIWRDRFKALWSQLRHQPKSNWFKIATARWQNWRKRWLS